MSPDLMDVVEVSACGVISSNRKPIDADEPEIKGGQTWLRKPGGRKLKSTPQIAIVGLDDDGRVQIERSFAYGPLRRRRNWIKAKSLRRDYVLYSDQTTLI